MRPVRGWYGLQRQNQYGVPGFDPTTQTVPSVVSVRLHREKNILAWAALRKASASLAVNHVRGLATIMRHCHRIELRWRPRELDDSGLVAPSSPRTPPYVGFMPASALTCSAHRWSERLAAGVRFGGRAGGFVVYPRHCRLLPAKPKADPMRDLLGVTVVSANIAPINQACSRRKGLPSTVACSSSIGSAGLLS